MVKKTGTPNIVQAERTPLQDHCGIFAAISPSDIKFFENGLRGLKKLQTRGYDGAGLGAIDSLGKTHTYKDEGLVNEVFDHKTTLKLQPLEARLWLYQVRYGTVGAFSKTNVQPLLRNHTSTDESFIAIHNGQFSLEEGDTYGADSDTVRFVDQLSKAPEADWDKRITNLLTKKNGAWSLAIGAQSKTDGFALYLARDPFGLRPLAYGAIHDARGNVIWVAASETSALKEVGIDTYFEILPGELVKITEKGPQVIGRVIKKSKLCIFENVYIMQGAAQAHLPREKKEQINESPSVDIVRIRTGEILAQEAPLSVRDVDLVIGIPGTGIAGGEAYARILRLPYVQAITDRTPQDDQRTFMHANIDKIFQRVLNHFNFDESALAGKRVVLVDDSIVRGNIMRGLVRLLKDKYGVLKVHVRVLSPPIDNACHLGINTKEREELLAAQVEDELGEMRNVKKIVKRMGEKLGVDSLAHISDLGLRKASTGDQNDDRFCMGCMIGHIPPVNIRGQKFN